MTTEILGRDSGQETAAQSGRLTFATLWRRALAFAQRILSRRHYRPRRLRLCETLPLGERRFVAVVEFEQARFLLGGTSSSVVLLARLADARPTSPSHDSLISEGMQFPEESRLPEEAR
jgi:flagellar biogenesis protein FliO